MHLQSFPVLISFPIFYSYQLAFSWIHYLSQPIETSSSLRRRGMKWFSHTSALPTAYRNRK